MFVDKENCLWIGTYRGGINFYSPSYDWFHVLSVGNNTLSHNVVTAIYPEKDYLYIGLDGGGLNVYNRKTGETVVYSCQNSTIAGNNILGICGDSENLWLVIYERGLCRFSRTSHTFKTYDFLSLNKRYDANQVWDIRQDQDGNIWILGALVYVFDKREERFITIDGVERASSIVFDGNMVWISSSHSGLYKLDRKAKKFVPITTCLPDLLPCLQMP